MPLNTTSKWLSIGIMETFFATGFLLKHTDGALRDTASGHGCDVLMVGLDDIRGLF